MVTQRTGQPSDKLSIIVVDENVCHANIARSVFAELEFRVMIYISPLEALNFLKSHDQDVDFCLVAVDMKEMHGFQFLGISKELHKDFQVIMMSNDTTWPIMKRCVELGARFLVKKPLDTYTVNNLWQHLDQKFARMKKIKELFQGVEGTTNGLNCLELEKSMNRCGDGTKFKAINLIWTPYLESKFAYALDLLREDATPSKIQQIMNIRSIKRKNISTHLQKHRKKIKKKLCNTNGKKCVIGAAGPNRCQYDPDIQLNNKTHEVTSVQTESFTEETEGNRVYYEAMQRALRLGVVFDESQLIRNDLFGEEANKGEVDMMAGGGDAQVDNTFAFGDINVVVSGETRNTDSAKEVTRNVANNCVIQVLRDGDQTGVVKLVAYSDSEDDEIGL